jgi:hypothetical protein
MPGSPETPAPALAERLADPVSDLKLLPRDGSDYAREFAGSTHTIAVAFSFS